MNCSSHLGYLQKVLTFADDNPGYQELVRGAASGLAAVAINGNADALPILFAAGIPSADPIRAPLALAVAKVALRNTPLMLQGLQANKDVAGALSLLAEGFDMLEEDLARMPDGQDTLIGPRGLRLSGGQVQRTAAARALVRRPDLLIVDDLSSALDVETEIRLWDRLRTAGTRTALLVSHRPPVLDLADRVIVLDEGRAV